MGLFDRMKLVLGGVPMRLWLTLDAEDAATPGSLLYGTVRLQGGSVEQRCDRICIRAQRTVAGQARELFHEAILPTHGGLWLGPGETREWSFSLRVPNDGRSVDDEILVTAHADVPGAPRPEAELCFMLDCPRAPPHRAAALRLRGGAAARLARF